jgi:hypothetical protein
LLRKHFAASWTELEELMSLFDLRAGYESLHQELEGRPSRYSSRVGAKASDEVVEINDEVVTAPDTQIAGELEQPSRKGKIGAVAGQPR